MEEKATFSQILSIWLPTQVTNEAQKTSNNILKWANTISPVVRLNTPEISPKNYKRDPTNIWDPNLNNSYWGIDIEIGKSISYFKSLNHLTKEAYSFLFRYDKKVKLGIAPNRLASFALSRFSNKEITISFPETLKRDLTNFPLECLQLDEHTKNILEELNISYLKDIINIRAKELNIRFPKTLSRSIENILKVKEIEINAPTIEKRINIQKTFLHTLDSQEIFFNSISQLMDKSFLILQEKHLSTSDIEIVLFYENNRYEIFSYPLSISLETKEKAWKILKPRIETIQYENCFSILIILKKLENQENKQTSFIADPQVNHPPKNLFIFLEEIKGRMQEEEIKTFKKGISHLSEHSNTLTSLKSFKTLTEKDIKLQYQKNLNTSFQVSTEDRPSIILRPPIKAEILKTTDKKFILKFHSKSLIITKFIGPEVVQTNWWQGSAETLNTTRAYYKLQLDSGLWIWAITESNLWLIHGIWS